MLQNASILAIVAVHTAENEPSKVGLIDRRLEPKQQNAVRRHGGDAALRAAVRARALPFLGLQLLGARPSLPVSACFSQCA